MDEQLNNFIDYSNLPKLKKLFKNYYNLKELSEIGYDSARTFILDCERGLDELNEFEREIFTKYFFDGYNMESVAKTLNISVGTVHGVISSTQDIVQAVMLNGEISKEKRIEYTYKEYTTNNKEAIKELRTNGETNRATRSRRLEYLQHKNDKTEQYLKKNDSKNYSDKNRNKNMEHPYRTNNAEIYTKAKEIPLSCLNDQDTVTIGQYIDNTNELGSKRRG